MSKISRSIIVAFFVVFVVFLGSLDFIYLNSKTDIVENGVSGWIKFGYVFLIVVLVSLYVYVKEKLSRMKIQKSIASMYKYSYIVLVMLASTFFKVYSVMNTYSTGGLFLYFILTLCIGILVQKIIFNISKSDVLSVIGMFVTYTIPNVISDNSMNLNSKLICFGLLLSAYVMQVLVDELKQLNIKNKKYLKEAIILGICIGISTLLGINYMLWGIIAFLLLFITSNLDSTSLNLSNRANKTIKKRKNNYFIYKIERIKISKLLVSIIIGILLTIVIHNGGKVILNSMVSRNNEIATNIVSDLSYGINSVKNYSFTNFKDNAYALASFSSSFYMVCYFYILAMEVLAFLLRRKYDTKTTILKVYFIALFTFITIFNVNILYYQPIFTYLLVIISIVNTTNIYYNREERIKMIEA